MTTQSDLDNRADIPYLLPLLAILAAFPPLTIDMYLPAIPYLGKLWNVDIETINLTLILFFLSYSPSLLIYGPFSDRFGRKIPLLLALLLFIMGCLLCAASGSVQILICGRILQGIGAAGPLALGLSITKDYYSGPERHKILAIISIIVSVAPMVGPTLGSWAMLLGSWHIIFIMQALIGVISFAGVAKLPETNHELRYIPLLKMMGPYGALFKNFKFISLTMLFAISMCPFFAFIVASPEIYINKFHLSEQTFGLLFGINALSLMAGSFTCMKISQKLSEITLIQAGFSCVLAGGIMLSIFPQSNALFFTFPMCLISIGFGLTRPMCLNMVLETVDRDTGSASSLMMFSNFVFGALAMWGISLGGDFKITIIGTMGIFSGVLTLISIWFIMNKKDSSGNKKIKETDM